MKIPTTVILSILALIMQATLMEKISIAGAKPDLLFLLAAYVAFEAYEIPNGLVGCWIVGIVKDIGSFGGLGGFALLFLIVGYMIMLVRNLFFRGDILMQSLIICGGSVIVNIIYAFFVLLAGNISFGEMLFRSFAISLYTMTV